MAKISIIVPVFNTAAYLTRCLESLFGQVHVDLEIILINDGSTDNSGELCESFAQRDKRIRVIHQANAGLSAARNAGLTVATGDYVGFVDSDDWITTDMYAYLLALLEQNQADIAEIMLDVAYSDAHLMPKITERIEVFKGDEILIHYFEHNEFAMGLRLYKRQIFTDIRFDVGRINEDYVAGFLALQKAQCLVVSNQPKYFYFSNEQGISESPLRRRDLDLLYAVKRLNELTIDSKNERLRNLALTRQYRAPFTLLVKMTIFGCSDELDKKQMIKRFKVDIRERYAFLMASEMPTNRKLMLFGCRFCYPLVCLAAKLYRLKRRAKA
jgi:glycosyltransferase involved in cell wall biosynthesis